MNLYRDAQQFPHSLLGGRAVVRSAALPAHGLTMNAARWQASRQRLGRPHRGVYLVGSTAIDLLDRARAALEVAPAAVLGYHTAAALLGFGVVPADAVHLVVRAEATFPQRPGIRVHRSALLVEPVTVLGLPCTPAARTAIDLARVLRRPDGLATLDAALASRACSIDELLDECARHERLRGCLRARELLGLADGRAQCVQESHLRLILRDGGLDTFEPQVPVWDGDRPRFVLDLADVRRRVAAECDGSSHLDRDRMRGDRRRHNYLEGMGWRMRYFTDDDIYRRPAEVVRVVTAALR